MEKIMTKKELDNSKVSLFAKKAKIEKIILNKIRNHKKYMVIFKGCSLNFGVTKYQCPKVMEKVIIPRIRDEEKKKSWLVNPGPFKRIKMVIKAVF